MPATCEQGKSKNVRWRLPHPLHTDWNFNRLKLRLKVYANAWRVNGISHCMLQYKVYIKCIWENIATLRAASNLFTGRATFKRRKDRVRHLTAVFNFNLDPKSAPNVGKCEL